ncbi:protein N-lysine methyltransferase METTL21A-like [Impatiens glandulifera]|uniref:protein N-lysine methyltransferase METTL21A-like n=1 Tax=Impatiens glandulifera TaxID=253017 RepID=UPI001FB0C3AB|nr:protein N-lysine methyltransferase METTL21A-like [Impatiens glandulifera]
MGIKEIQISNKNLKIHEPDDIYDSQTGRALTGSWVWDSAPILSQWMASKGILQFDFIGKTVIELGAGTGLPGLTTAILGASHVFLTDVESLIPTLNKNVEVNGLEDRVKVSRLVWGSLDEIPSSNGFDLVVMSDVFFDSDEVSKLVKTLKKICGDNTKVWAASEVRQWTGDCVSVLEAGGFEVVELFVHRSDGLDDFAIYQLIPPPLQRNSNDF